MKIFIFTSINLVFLFVTKMLCISQEVPCAPIQEPVYSEITRADFELKLNEARESYEKDSSNAEALIWYGRRLAYLGRYMEAIAVFSIGINKHPSDARMYRHRGHRFITVRCFDRAISDLESASGLIKGQKDETEPDGLPIARNTPTSTLQSNIWYHLGLVYFLKGDYGKAIKAYTTCLEVSLNPDMYVATANWLYISFLRLNKATEARELLNTINSGMDVIENRDYLRILLLFKEEQKEADFLNQEASLSGTTLLFGLGNYYITKGEIAKAKEALTKIVSGNQWASFAYIAAEKALKELP